MAMLDNENLQNLQMQKETTFGLLECKGIQVCFFKLWDNETLVNIYEAPARCQALSWAFYKVYLI